MQMHSASETKAVFVGSQRPPPQSPSSFPWIGTLTFPTIMRPRITLSLLHPPTLSPHLPAGLSALPVSLSPFPRGTAEGRLQYALQSEANEDIQLGTVQRKSFVAVEEKKGASDSTNLIIPNVSSLRTESTETAAEYTPQRQCFDF